MKFCIEAGPSPWVRAADRSDAVARTLEIARVADQAGVDSLWAMEDPDGWDAFAVLAAVATHTQSIRLGTGVVNPYYRHPALIAASVSTLDSLSNGRAFLGIGRGQPEWYSRALGMTIGSPLARLEESIDLLRQWWEPPHAARSGADATEFGVTGWERSFGPEHPRLPIYIAAVGPKALDLAADVADGVVFNDLSSLTFMHESIEKIRSRRGSLDRFDVYARCSIVLTDDPEAEYERRKATVAMIHALPRMEPLLETPGFDVERMIADVRAAMRTDEVMAAGGGFSEMRRQGDLAAAKRAIPADLMRELVVAGSPADVRHRLAQMADIGITHAFVANPPAHAEPGMLAAVITALTTGA